MRYVGLTTIALTAIGVATRAKNCDKKQIAINVSYFLENQLSHQLLAQKIKNSKKHLACFGY